MATTFWWQGCNQPLQFLLRLHRDVFALANPPGCLISKGNRDILEHGGVLYQCHSGSGIKSDYHLAVSGYKRPVARWRCQTWSFGGILTLEIARKPVRHGSHVLDVMLIDSLCDGKHAQLLSSIEHILSFWMNKPFKWLTQNSVSAE